MASSMEPSSSGMIEGRGGEDDNEVNDTDSDDDDGCSSPREILVVLVDVLVVLDVIVFAREW